MGQRCTNHIWGEELSVFFFFFNTTWTTEIYTLSLHDALPIYRGASGRRPAAEAGDRSRRARVHLRSWRLAGAALPWEPFDIHIGKIRRTRRTRSSRRRRSEEHTSELQSQSNLVCRLLLEKKKK